MSLRIQVTPNDSVAVDEIGGGGYYNSATDGYNLTKDIIYNNIMNLLQDLGANQTQIDLYITLWDQARVACEALN